MMARTFGLRLGEAAAVIARMTRPFDRPDAAIGAGDGWVDHAMGVTMTLMVTMTSMAMAVGLGIAKAEPIERAA